MAKAKLMLVRLLCILLRGYQLSLRPILPPSCRFYPSCSDYAIDALKSQGPILGGWFIIKRLSRCHPWCEGGFDPVKPN